MSKFTNYTERSLNNAKVRRISLLEKVNVLKTNTWNIHTPYMTEARYTI